MLLEIKSQLTRYYTKINPGPHGSPTHSAQWCSPRPKQQAQLYKQADRRDWFSPLEGTECWFSVSHSSRRTQALNT